MPVLIIYEQANKVEKHRTFDLTMQLIHLNHELSKENKKKLHYIETYFLIETFFSYVVRDQIYHLIDIFYWLLRDFVISKGNTFFEEYPEAISFWEIIIAYFN